MGAADMVINSIEQDDTSPDHAQKLSDALKYLVLPQHMGEKFKVLALAPKRDGIFAPAGMET
jgi:SAM-dependent MidA family methyltransferase